MAIFSPRDFISANRAVVTLRFLDESALGGVWVDIAHARLAPRWGDFCSGFCHSPGHASGHTAALPLEQRHRRQPLLSAAPATDRALLRPPGRHGHAHGASELPPSQVSAAVPGHWRGLV